MVLGGPVGVVAGLAMLSGGVGGTMNAVSQARDPNTTEFSAGKFIGHVAVNGVIGAATGGMGTAV